MDTEKDSGSNGKKRKMQIVSMDHARRRRSQQLPVSTESVTSAQTRAQSQPYVDSHNQLYKLTESVQLLDDKVVNMERMLRKLLRLLRNVTSSRD
jgi:hypothetical protein